MNRSMRTLSPVDLENAHLEIDSKRGTFRDARGRDVVMRGVNTGGRSKWSPFVPFPVDSPEPSPEEVEERATSYFRRVTDWGFDTVRLPFSWEALEPRRGTYDEDYRTRYGALLDAADTLDLRVIVDFHQDIFSSAFSGDGFPLWAVPEGLGGPPRHDHAGWFMKYAFDPGVRAAFERFWKNEDGLRDAFIEMWTSMAAAFGDHPAVVAFEPINEPGWGETADVEAWKLDVLRPFYAELHSVLRGIAPDVLVLYDGPGVDALYPRAATLFRPEGDGLVFGPHYYDNGLVHGGGWSGGRPEPVIEHFDRFREEHATPVVLGEFGIGHGAHRGTDWLRRLADALDFYRVSATLWEFSLTGERWNGEDLNIVDADGCERPAARTFARPWLRAVAGTHSDFAWDPDRRAGRAGWLAEGGISEIRVPERCAAAGPERIAVEGLGTDHTWDPERGELRVDARPGSLVDVEFEFRAD